MWEGLLPQWTECGITELGRVVRDIMQTLMTICVRNALSELGAFALCFG